MRYVGMLLLAALTQAGCGCTGPALEAWHSERLDAEFRASRAQQVQSLAGYRELEERLFRELDEAVYARVEASPANQLMRYSPGSAADPRGREPDWNRSLQIEEATEEPVGGLLLLHGMSDSPYSFRALAQAASRRGYRVLGLRLPGHGTAPSGLRFIRAQDLEAAVRLAMRHLAEELGERPIHIAGYSAGAALALSYALDALEGDAWPVPASLVLVSPAIRVHPLARAARFKNALSGIPGLGHLAWTSVLPEFDPYKYNSFAVNGGAVVSELARSVDRRLASRSRAGPEQHMPPVLVFKSAVDATVSTEAVVDRLLARLEPHRHELVLFDINRAAAASLLLVSDPAPLTDRLMGDDALPFHLTVVSNVSPEGRAVAAWRKAPFQGLDPDPEPLGLAWPLRVVSLSHVALPFPPDDPLYGEGPPGDEDRIFLGGSAVQGERGLLTLPASWQLRMRYNPFYPVLEERALEWFGAAGDGREDLP